METVPLPPAASGPGSQFVTDTVPPPAPTVRTSRSGTLGLWLRDLVFSALASILIITFLYQPVRVEGTSMLPGLEDSDRLFINKFVYHIEAISRGDIVVFRYPQRRGKELYQARHWAARRPSAHHPAAASTLMATRSSEPYVPEQYRDDRSYSEITIPPDHYFMMGDHRSISLTAANSAPFPANSSTAKPSLSTGLRKMPAWFVKRQILPGIPPANLC